MREEANKIVAEIEGRMMTMPEDGDIKSLSDDIHKMMEG
jgi:hypothetical protein